MRCVSEYGRISDLQEIARAVPDCRFLLATAHRLPACAESETVYAPYVPASNHGFFCGCMLYFSYATLNMKCRYEPLFRVHIHETIGLDDSRQSI